MHKGVILTIITMPFLSQYVILSNVYECILFRFRYSEDDVVVLLVQVLQGLEYLHNHRVIHLDIKPENVMVTNLSIVKIIDFGSAQKFNPLSLKPCNKDLGTLEYTGTLVLLLFVFFYFCHCNYIDLFLQKMLLHYAIFHYILPFYAIAPEILKGDVVGPPADMWSLGVLTYVM